MSPQILALHAHPDDLETLAAGALALLAKDGAQITMATLTAGECGAISKDRERTAATRRAEAQEAAALIGARYICLGEPDLGVFSDDRTRRRVVDLIREVRPDIVMASPPQDYHPDHEATGVLARDACFAASVPGYDAGEHVPLTTIPHLYWIAPMSGGIGKVRGDLGEFVVDISNVIEVKRRMLSAHRSQAEWLQQQHGIIDFIATMEAESRRTGQAVGVTYAETYRQYRGHPFPRSPRLQELLKSQLRAI